MADAPHDETVDLLNLRGTVVGFVKVTPAPPAPLTVEMIRDALAIMRAMEDTEEP